MNIVLELERMMLSMDLVNGSLVKRSKGYED